MTKDEIIWGIVGAALVALRQWYEAHRAKAKIRAHAKKILSDPRRTNDAEEAVAEATIDTLRPRIRSESRKLTGDMNGGHKGER